MSESEKLQNMKLRQELGIDSLISIFMKDDPSLTEKQAEEKLKKLLEQKLKEKMIQKELGGDDLEVYEEEENETMEETESESEIDPESPQSENEVDTSEGTPTVGDTAASVDQNVQQSALNGAQVTSLVDIVEKVAGGTLPRDSAINMIILAFNVKPQDAEKILGTAGKGFKIETPEPVNAPQMGNPINESDKQDDQ
jgi:hypothetical protein